MIESTTVGIIMIPLMFLFLFMGLPVVFSIALSAVVCLHLWGGVPMVLIFSSFSRESTALRCWCFPCLCWPAS